LDWAVAAHPAKRDTIARPERSRHGAALKFSALY